MAASNTEAIVKLCENSRIRDEVRDFLMAESSEGGLGLDSLDDIITMASDEKSIEALISNVEGIDAPSGSFEASVEKASATLKPSPIASA